MGITHARKHTHTQPHTRPIEFCPAHYMCFNHGLLLSETHRRGKQPRLILSQGFPRILHEIASRNLKSQYAS